VHLVRLFEETCARRAGERALVWGDRAWTWAEVRDEAMRVAGGLDLARGDRVAIMLPNGPENIFCQFGVMMAGGVRVPVNAAYTARESAHPIEHARCRVVIAGGTGRGEPRCVEPAEIAMICYTSGTSGRPKGVPITHAMCVHNIRGLVERWEWTERDVLVLSLPLMHVHGLHNGLHGWIATGCTLVLLEKFDPPRVLDAIERHRATMFFGVPAMYHRLLEAPKRVLPSMRLWVSGSAPLDEGLAERFERAYGPVVNRYGMTETLMITANPARGPRRGVGLPLPGVNVRVLQSGEIVVRGPNVAGGYWGGETDEATRHEDGFFRTGDLGRIDADGYLFITGRAKDIIISGGTNIAPVEIEEVLLKHPNVAEALALPVPDPALGEVVRAVVVPRGTLTREDVAAWCERHLAKFKRPRDVRIVDAPLPRNAMQKLDRKKAKELYGA